MVLELLVLGVRFGPRQFVTFGLHPLRHILAIVQLCGHVQHFIEGEGHFPQVPAFKVGFFKSDVDKVFIFEFVIVAVIVGVVPVIANMGICWRGLRTCGILDSLS